MKELRMMSNSNLGLFVGAQLGQNVILSGTGTGMSISRRANENNKEPVKVICHNKTTGVPLARIHCDSCNKTRHGG
jgi:hypothetical protein